MRYVIWCEVNRAWEDACLVWAYSLCRELSFCEHEIKVVIFYDVGKLTSESSSVDNDITNDSNSNTTSFSNRVQQIGMRFNIEIEVELFSSRDFVSDLPDNFSDGRCIDRNSVGIAISRVMNYNKLLSYTDDSIQPMMLSADNSSCSHNVINSNLRICNPNNSTDLCSTDNGVVYIHCDIDGIFLEDSNLELLFDGIDSVIADNDSPLLIGVNEYDDISSALAKTHSEEFMKRLDGVYLNCGFICFYNVPPLNLTDLKDFLSTEDSYCLEQDYLNLLGCNSAPSLTRICLQPQYNYTYRKMLVETSSPSHPTTTPTITPLTLPVFVHYYGSDKPFLPNPKSTNGIDSDVPPAIAHYYFPEYGQLVFKIRCLLSVDFVNLVRKRCVEEYWVEQNTNIV